MEDYGDYGDSIEAVLARYVWGEAPQGLLVELEELADRAYRRGYRDGYMDAREDVAIAEALRDGRLRLADLMEQEPTR